MYMGVIPYSQDEVLDKVRIPHVYGGDPSVTDIPQCRPPVFPMYMGVIPPAG